MIPLSKREYKHDNVITIGKDVPIHLLAYWIGVLRGMGLTCKIHPDSPMYRLLREGKAELYRQSAASRKVKDKLPFKDSYRVFHEGGDADSISVSVKPIHEIKT